MTKVHDVLTDILGTVAKLTMSPSDTDELTLPKVIVFHLFCLFYFTMFAFWHQNRPAMSHQITYQFKEITLYYKKER